jgi:hypothetical protein
MHIQDFMNLRPYFLQLLRQKRRNKFVISEGQLVQPPTKVIGQVGSVRYIYLFCIVLTANVAY